MKTLLLSSAASFGLLLAAAPAFAQSQPTSDSTTTTTGTMDDPMMDHSTMDHSTMDHSTTAQPTTTSQPATTPPATATAQPYTMTTTQQAEYDGWDATRRATYDAWPGDVQGYYYTLGAPEKEAFWLLTDEQRVQLYRMEPAPRTAAWASIMQQVNAQGAAAASPAGTADTTMPPMDSGSTTTMEPTDPMATTTGSMMSDTDMATSTMSNDTMATAPAGAGMGTSAMADTSMAGSGNMQFVRNETAQAAPAARQGEYPVCKGDQQDGCINSWEANKTGNKPLDYWPGRPASEIDGPMPAAPATTPAT